MDVAGVSMALADMDVQSKASVKVLGNALDMNEALGAGMVAMIDSAAMEQSVNPHLGSNLDLRV